MLRSNTSEISCIRSARIITLDWSPWKVRLEASYEDQLRHVEPPGSPTDEFGSPTPSIWLALANSTRRIAGASELAPLGDRERSSAVVAPEGSPGAIVRARRPAHDPNTIEVEIRGRIDRSDAARLGREVRSLLEDRDAEQIVCDVGSITRADAAVVDALCRMRLVARRRGCQFRLRDASRELLDLLILVGLTDVLPLAPRSALEVERQPEQREHPGGVEEERDPTDPTV
jgi:anti-anti-sigma factor